MIEADAIVIEEAEQAAKKQKLDQQAANKLDKEQKKNYQGQKKNKMLIC